MYVAIPAYIVYKHNSIHQCSYYQPNIILISAYCPYSNYPGVNLYYLTRYAIAIGTTHMMLNI